MNLYFTSASQQNYFGIISDVILYLCIHLFIIVLLFAVSPLFAHMLSFVCKLKIIVIQYDKKRFSKDEHFKVDSS